MRKFHLLLFLLISFTFISCLKILDPGDPDSSFRINFTAQGFGGSHSAGSDTINFNSLTLNMDSLYFSRHNADDVRFNQSQILVNYLSVHQNQEIALAKAKIPGGIYTGINFDIKPPSPGDPIQDPALVVTENNQTKRYALVLQGVYNSQVFTYRTSIRIDKTIPFDKEVELQDKNNTLLIRLSTDVRRWFEKNEGTGLLNPLNGDDKDEINSNISNTLEIGGVVIQN